MDSFENVRKNQMLRQVQKQSQLGALYFSYMALQIFWDRIPLAKSKAKIVTLLTVVFRSLGPTNLGVISCRIV